MVQDNVKQSERFYREMNQLSGRVQKAEAESVALKM
jgi:hypothetical protein